MTEDWRVVSTTPAILADVVEVLPALTRLRFSHPRPVARERFVRLRWADVMRRVAPSEALDSLVDLPEADEPDVPHLSEAAVRAASMFERGQWRDARELVEQVERRGGAKALLEGRVALQEQAFDDAEQLWSLAEAEAEAATHPLAVEVRAEALGYRMRLAIVRGVDARGLWERMEALCKEHGAGFTQGAFRLVHQLETGSEREARLDAAARAASDAMEQRYIEPFRDEEAKVAPVPLVVHGIAKVHHRQPEAYFEAITTQSAMAWRRGDRQHGYDIAWYGRAIGGRLMGPKMEEALTTYLDHLLEPLEPARREAFAWRLQFRARLSKPLAG
jgi:hypothetical protein